MRRTLHTPAANRPTIAFISGEVMIISIYQSEYTFYPTQCMIIITHKNAQQALSLAQVVFLTAKGTLKMQMYRFRIIYTCIKSACNSKK